MKQRQPIATGLLPLVVGVTGHRDVVNDERADIAARVRSLFETLRASYPHTPIVLLSALAEGADRLVADTALDCGVQLFAVLPMDKESYEGDFSSTDSLDHFRSLLDRSNGATVVSVAAGASREERYAAAGAFLAGHSHILIAVWDGNTDEMLGGTSQVVRFALQGVPSAYLSESMEPLGSNETGAVFHIAASRASANVPRDSVKAAWLYPTAASTAQGNLRNLERFNRDATTLPIDRQARLSAESLLAAPDSARFGALGEILEYTRALFGQADALALRCRNMTHGAMLAIFCTIGLAAIFFSLYTSLFATVPALYFVFLGLVAGALATNALVDRSRLQDRFQDYRALAEGLRVQFFWRLAGISDSVYDHYLARQAGELEWIRDAMRASRFHKRDEANRAEASTDQRALLEAILGRWLREQGRYFSKAARREQQLAVRTKLCARACLLVTALIALALAAGLLGGRTSYQGELIVLLTLSLAFAGLFTGYAQKRAHEEHARRYERMGVLYGVAAQRMQPMLDQNDLPGARAVLVQLGREALAETCDWLQLHREREIEVPTG